MTETNSNPPATPPTADDPRYGFAAVAQALGELIETVEAIEPSVLDGSTPCPEFAVSDLLDHVVMVMRRVAVIGNGGHFSEIEQDKLGSGWAEAFRSAAHDVMQAWTDPAKLEQVYEVPWGQIPGGPMMYTYTAELSVHGWDIATATGQSFSMDDDVLKGAMMAIQMVPAEGRDNADVPFSEVVDPGPDASVLLQLAGWAGRPVG